MNRIRKASQEANRLRQVAEREERALALAEAAERTAIEKAQRKKSKVCYYIPRLNSSAYSNPILAR